MRSFLVAVVFACLCVIGASYRSYQDYALFSVKGLTNDMKFYQHIVDNFDIWGVDEEGFFFFFSLFVFQTLTKQHNFFFFFSKRSSCFCKER